MADYKLKLKALLHDPIDKQYVMWKLQENHKEVAQRYFNHIFPNEKLEEEKIKTADRLASAISRIIGEKEIKIEWQEINYIDLFSLKTKEIGKPKDDNEVKTFFERLGTLTFKDENERAELCFLFLWRFLPEIFPWITTHPADSRAPNHSIYDHLVQTSAIVSCLPKPAFLLFTIGPVQEFIATARKTSDLWAGSYLLSYLTYKAIEIILEELGPDNVIYPNLLAQPLVDKWLYEKFENTSIENFKEEIYFKKYIDNCFQEETLTIANFPNRFLAIVPFEKAEDIG
ncbi:MAG: type III-B CRISPR-associated protein Cas10/Cmr2, partial [candidate division WOR-3 bacterium]